jgi:hypothetical protein
MGRWGFYCFARSVIIICLGINKKDTSMNHKTLAIILAVLLGGMALYYNQAVSDNAVGDNGSKTENAVIAK